MGYRCLSRSVFHALSSFFNLSISPVRRFDKYRFPSANSSISAIFSQFPCFGVWCISIRLASLRASVDSTASYKEVILWVFRLSHTRITYSTSEYCSSRSPYAIFLRNAPAFLQVRLIFFFLNATNLHMSLKTFFSVTGTDRLHCGCGSIECQSSFPDCHRLFPITVNCKKNGCSEDRSIRHFSGTYHFGERLALCCRQTHLVLFYRHNRNSLFVATQSCE